MVNLIEHLREAVQRFKQGNVTSVFKVNAEVCLLEKAESEPNL